MNLKPSRNLSPESGKVFAALLLAGYLQAALDRAEKPKPHFMYLDECQNYLSIDAAKMLDQVPKSGLRLTLTTTTSASSGTKSTSTVHRDGLPVQSYVCRIADRSGKTSGRAIFSL